MRINNNIPALYAYNSVNSTNNAMQKSIQKLSSGLRINSAADDAAGLTISEKMRSQIKGMDQAIGNSQDGINMIQTAEGALSETTSILQRMRELSVQSANDTLTANDRQAVQDEVDQLAEEIDRISNTTQFNKKKLLNGDAAALTSTDNLKTKVFVKGGLREIDQFGQKSASEGNYKIAIEATAGQAQVQKTDIFKIKHGGEDLVSSNVGYATTTAGASTVTTGLADGDTVTLTFEIGGTSYTDTFTQSGSTASVGGTATLLETFVDSSSTLSDYVDATATGAELTFQSKVGGETLKVSWAVGGTGTAEIEGAASGATATMDPADQNIKSIDVTPTDFFGGDYKVITTDNLAGVTAAAAAATVYDQKDATDGLINTGGSGIVAETTGITNQSLMLKVDSIDEATDKVTFSYELVEFDQSGNASTLTGTKTLTADGVDATTANDNTVFGGVTFANFDLEDSSSFSVGDKLLINTTGASAATDDAIQMTKDGTSLGTFVADAGTFDNKETTLQFYQLDTDTGEQKLSSVDIEMNASMGDTSSTYAAAEFTVESNVVGAVAGGDTSIYDVDKFWDSNGNFMVEDPQTLQLVQGDGKKTSITIYKDDTMDGIATKINDAMRGALEQGKLEGLEASTNFAQFIDASEVTDDTPASVAGTMLINSAINGSDGEITFVGDEEFINALSLNVIQDSQENKFNVNITDAHSGEDVASNVQVTGNKLVGVLHDNVDIEFDTMADVKVNWDSAENKWDSTGDSDDYETIVHLADNTTVFQIGANEKEDMGINIGDMSAEALGVDNIQVTDRENAARSITVIDDAIAKVSKQRSGLGAYQNRLEHTINNLTTGSTNITAAESRIRDVDMAKEMMKYTSLNVLMQAGNSMLGQAKALPENVLSLLR